MNPKQTSIVMQLLVLAAGLIFAISATAKANDRPPIRIASWNMGWHVSMKELDAWIRACDQFYARDDEGIWQLSSSNDAIQGWSITESRAKVSGIDMRTTPPCSVYRADGYRGHVAVSPAAYAKRNEQIAVFLRERVQADIIAFQEVSGRTAVLEALGSDAANFEVCSFDGEFKVQRLAFAWRKDRVRILSRCKVHGEIALPDLSFEAQLRPGLSMTAEVAGRSFQLLNLHLKSGCVSALDGGILDAESSNRTQRSTKPRKSKETVDPCPILQQQIEPLELVIEQLAEQKHPLIVLGDFNRNLWHEQAAGDGPIRSDGSSPSSRLTGRKTNNLLREINDGVPSSSKAFLVKLSCGHDPQLRSLCDFSNVGVLKGADRQMLTGSRGLGCRNGVGLDHFLVSEQLQAAVLQGQKIAIGRLGRTLGPGPERREPLLSISDHCPIVLSLKPN